MQTYMIVPIESRIDIFSPRYGVDRSKMLGCTMSSHYREFGLEQKDLARCRNLRLTKESQHHVALVARDHEEEGEG